MVFNTRGSCRKLLIFFHHSSLGQTLELQFLTGGPRTHLNKLQRVDTQIEHFITFTISRPLTDNDKTECLSFKWSVLNKSLRTACHRPCSYGSRQGILQKTPAGCSVSLTLWTTFLSFFLFCEEISNQGWLRAGHTRNPWFIYKYRRKRVSHA